MKAMATKLHKTKKLLGLKTTKSVRPTRRKAARLGQNFLMHSRIAERIVDVSKIVSDSVVLEIGPGTGMLTRQLLKRASKVIAIEADRDLYEKLCIDFENEITSGRLELIHGDIRSYPLSTTTVYDRGYEVVANIPYYLTGEIFRMFLESKNQPSSMTLLVQKEVAERVARSKKESILSLSVKAYGTPKYEFTVPRGAFTPAPNVDSSALTISDISRKNFTSRAEEQRFFELIHAGFAHKRKYVWSNLVEARLIPAKTAKGGLLVAPFDGAFREKARAEDLSLSDWLALMHRLV